MNNLFSVFDPSTSLYNLSINWLGMIFGFFFIPQMFWLLNCPISFFWNSIILKLHNEFNNITFGKSGSTLIFISLFSFILFNNMLGLFPYIFTSTSHLVLGLTLSLPLWFSFMLYGWFNNIFHMLVHQVPQGTPMVLMPFMVLIEFISNIIRPGTLAVRLTANMIAGHLLMTLLGNNGPLLSSYLVIFLIMIQVMLMILEFSVSIIQSYVFTVLSLLYSGEVE